MFDDFNGIYCQSWNSAGKVTIKTPYFERSENSRKISEVPIFPDDERSHKGRPGWATMGPDKAQAWARAMSGRPGPPRTETLRVYLRHGNLRSRERPEKYSAASAGRKTTKREK